MTGEIDHQILERIRAEFLEMPGMRLRIEQVRRLCGVDAEACRAVLESLVAMKFLRLDADGTYARLTLDSIHLRTVKAALPVAVAVPRRAS